MYYLIIYANREENNDGDLCHRQVSHKREPLTPGKLITMSFLLVAKCRPQRDTTLEVCSFYSP